jgi:hypothetical protein
VEISTMTKGFDGLTGRILKDVDVLMGADICFWDGMEDALKRLILRALRAGTGRVLIADPGRDPFYRLCEYFTEKRGAESLEWSTTRPRAIQGHVLKIDASA